MQSCGGGVSNAGLITMTNVTLHHNQALKGGGVCNYGGSVVGTDVSLDHNTVISDGGGLYSDNEGYVELSQATVYSNTAGESGGGIYNDWLSAMTLVDSSVTYNTAGDVGGGIANEEALTIIRSLIDHNTATDGGGIYARALDWSPYKLALVLEESTISENTATHDGGGLYTMFFDDAGDYHYMEARLTNCTLSGNSAGNRGGGIFNGSSTVFTHTTVSENEAAIGAGIANTSTRPVTLTASLIADNVTGGDCNGDTFSNGYNLDSDDTCGLNTAGDITGANPELAPLVRLDHGTSLPLHPLYDTSPAIDSIPALSCTLTTDQRGAARPQNGDCDIGAYEYLEESPAAVDDVYVTQEDAPLNIAAPGVLSNDVEVNGQTMTAALDQPPITGTLVISADGALVYTPPADWSGVGAATYIVSDGALTGTGLVEIIVEPVNDAPVATTNVYTTDEDVSFSGNVLTEDTGNGADSDAENDLLTAVRDTNVGTGVLVWYSSGTFFYFPPLNYNGTVTFTYHANDGDQDSNTALVTITVNESTMASPVGGYTEPVKTPVLFWPWIILIAIVGVAAAIMAKVFRRHIIYR